MNSILIIVNDPPYGTEKAYNAMRLANQINKDFPDTAVRIFLLADAVSCARKEQNTPAGYYNIERMLRFSINKGTEVKICTSCLDARGLIEDQLMDGIKVSTMAELAEWVVTSDRVLNF